MVSNDTPKAAQAGLGGPGWACVDLRGPGKHFFESLCSNLDCRRREEKKDTHIAMVSNDLPEAAKAGLSGPRWAWADLGGSG